MGSAASILTDKNDIEIPCEYYPSFSTWERAIIVSKIEAANIELRQCGDIEWRVSYCDSEL